MGPAGLLEPTGLYSKHLPPSLDHLDWAVVNADGAGLLDPEDKVWARSLWGLLLSM